MIKTIPVRILIKRGEAMTQQTIFKKNVNGIEYKVKNDESTDRLYLYKNDDYQGAISFLDLFE